MFVSHHCIDQNNIILCGDYNCKTLDKNDKSSCKLVDIVDYLEMKDIWVEKHDKLNGIPGVTETTYHIAELIMSLLIVIFIIV